MTSTATSRRIAVIGYEIPSDLGLERELAARCGATLVDLRDRQPADVIDELAGACAILTEGTVALPRAVIERLDEAVAISISAVGTDAVDIAAATERGIAVTNVDDYCLHEVAEHTVALILATWRRLGQAQRVARSGSWSLEELRPIRGLQGATCGLLGFGRIARQVARRLAPFGVHVIAHDPALAENAFAEAAFVELVGLDELLRRSDILSLHAPLTPATAGMIDADALAKLPAGAILVNCGRGRLIDADAVHEALASGRLAGAGLDVFEDEPAPPDHPLLARDDVICTPHMAYYSEEALLELRRRATQNAVDAIEGRMPAAVVNAAGLDGLRTAAR